MPATPTHIIERNRRNAQHSTGPRTAGGKAMSRANATKHGLTANPAAGVVEDAGAFERLLEALTQRFCPNDVMEEAHVHRIAVSLWRLQRAARIDGAIAGLQIEAIRPERERIHEWLTEITQSFAAVRWGEVTDQDLLRRRHAQKPETKGQKWYRAERQFLAKADRYRDEVLMVDGIAIRAVMLLIRQLTDQLKHAGYIDAVQAQLLAWLMGESAERLEQPEDAEDRSANYYPDERRFASPVDDLIGQARKRPPGEPFPAALHVAIESRLTDLDARSRTAETPHTEAHEKALQIEAMLPEAGTLDRLMRYEAHAERSLMRAIEMLSRLRGVTVASIRATMSRSPRGDQSLQVSGEQTTWSGA